jgi:hypothetical protein
LLGAVLEEFQETSELQVSFLSLPNNAGVYSLIRKDDDDKKKKIDLRIRHDLEHFDIWTVLTTLEKKRPPYSMLTKMSKFNALLSSSHTRVVLQHTSVVLLQTVKMVQLTKHASLSRTLRDFQLTATEIGRDFIHTTNSTTSSTTTSTTTRRASTCSHNHSTALARRNMTKSVSSESL